MWLCYRSCLRFLAYICLLCVCANLAYAQELNPSSPQNPVFAKQDSTLPMFASESLESNLDQHSFFTHRYTTRFDKQHEIRAMGVYGESKVGTNLSRYAGGAILYDGIIDRYPLGAFIGYVYGQAPFLSPAHTQMLTLGVFSDVLLQAHRIQVFVAQSFQASKALNAEHLRMSWGDWAFASSSNAILSYGYVFALNNGAGSFIEPYIRYNLHALFPINTQGAVISSYMLRTNIDLGILFKQFIGSQFIASISPSFRQDVGVIGADSFARPLVIDPNGELIIALSDRKYHSYGLLSLGLEWRAGHSCTIAFKAHGIYTSTAYLYSGNLGVNVLF